MSTLHLWLRRPFESCHFRKTLLSTEAKANQVEEGLLPRCPNVRVLKTTVKARSSAGLASSIATSPLEKQSGKLWQLPTMQ
ncbi:hypothetical protein PI125_g16213 [Phytophthora idaei]|nr:hypothetical protein PI125_g16213 [Phytophthora idaei]